MGVNYQWRVCSEMDYIMSLRCSPTSSCNVRTDALCSILRDKELLHKSQEQIRKNTITYEKLLSNIISYTL